MSIKSLLLSTCLLGCTAGTSRQSYQRTVRCYPVTIGGVMVVAYHCEKS